MASAPANTTQRKVLNDLLDNLFRMRDEMKLLDIRAAKPEKFAEYNDHYYKIGLAISAVNGVLLKSLTSDFASELPQLEAATRKVADDLYSLRRTSAVLNSISTAMSTVASIITLAK